MSNEDKGNKTAWTKERNPVKKKGTNPALC